MAATLTPDPTLTPTPSDGSAAEAVARRIDDERIETVIAAGCDLNGVLRGKYIPAARFQKSPTAPIPFCEVIYLVDLQEAIIPAPPDAGDWWPRVETGVGDLHAVPDLSTFRSVPWLPGTALVLCDHHRLDGTPIEVSPRSVLKRCIQEAETQGLVPKMAAELEFCLFRRPDAGGNPGPLQPASSRSTTYGLAGGGSEGVLSAIRRHAGDFGIPIECTSLEIGAGQCEINLCYSEVLLAADRAFLYKHAVKELADRHGLVASFMAKPTPSYGSSCHLHQSLWSPDGQNLFSDPDAPHGLSGLAGSFIAGQLATLSELACLYAPTVNSYKRLVPMSAAPTTVSWGHDNRTTALRIPGDARESMRVENRCPGADVNVYLAMAAALAGGLYGIEHQLVPPAPVTGNAYAEPDLEPLPTSLEAAVGRFEASEVARRFLGDHFVEFYAASRRWEIEQFRTQPTDWEIRRYLELV
jgi:glutamine synthetase